MFMLFAQEDIGAVVRRDGERDLRDSLRHFLRTTKMTPNDISIAMGYVQAKVKALVDFLGGADLDAETAGRLAELLGYKDDWRPQPTANLRAVFEMCRHVARRGRIGAISGRAGYGKTEALRLYARTQGAVYYAYDEVSGPRTIIRELCRLAGVHNFENQTVGEFLRRLIEEMRRKPRTLLIDQADTLPFKALEAVRAVHDQTDCPVILAGIEGRLMARLMRRNARENAEQIFSRITAHIVLPPPSVEDVETICAAFGIRAARSIAFVHKRAAVGGYRAVRTLCEDAQDVAAVNESKAISFEHIQKASEYLITTLEGEAA
jgi:DNA transposition AAA+ family ATPase